MPEAIKNEDGTKKQDCELNASKRFVANLRPAHPRQEFMIFGDGLMSNQPMIEETIKGDMHYLFVAKAGNHKYLVEWLSAFNSHPSTELVDGKGNSHIYTWQNDVPLNGNAKPLRSIGFNTNSKIRKEKSPRPTAG